MHEVETTGPETDFWLLQPLVITKANGWVAISQRLTCMRCTTRNVRLGGWVLGRSQLGLHHWPEAQHLPDHVPVAASCAGGLFQA